MKIVRMRSSCCQGQRCTGLRRKWVQEVLPAISSPPESDYSAAMTEPIYKICPAGIWREAEEKGVFAGVAIDLTDGYIHFSTAGQVEETAARHFAGQENLVLVAVDPNRLGTDLKYEVSRGGALFPHLYAPLYTGSVLWVRPLPVGPDGRHVFPDLAA